MGRIVSLEGLPEKTQEEILKIVAPKKKHVVDLSPLDEDLQHGINKVILKDEINMVRRFLKQRKEQRQ